MRRVGRPSIVGTMARTAAIAGTATVTSAAVGGAMASKSAKKQAAAEQQAADQAAAEAPPAEAPAAAEAAAAPAGGTTDTIAQLKDLAALKDSGILTDEEFEAQKAKILAG